MAKKNQKKKTQGRTNNKKKNKGPKRQNTQSSLNDEENNIDVETKNDSTDQLEVENTSPPENTENGNVETIESTGTEPAPQSKEEIPEVDVTNDVTEPEKEEAVTTEPEPEPESKQETDELALVPEGLQKSLSLFTESQQALAISLCSKEANQVHLFEKWPAPSKVLSPSAEATNKVKLRMMEKLERMNEAYPAGGLLGYISNARDLLEKSRSGVNPLDGWSPNVPQGQSFELGTSDFDEVEQIGLKEIGKCGFVLVAGGLGERLGYGDIKIGLPTEMATETSYIQYYIETILAYQAKYGEGKTLPLCIMTSGDTNAKTVALLEKNNNFGMEKNQITIVIQGDGVPALENNDARIALDPLDRYEVLSKPHGHGDIHALLHSHEVAKTWLSNGIEWTVFFQDTNGLAFHSLPLALGVSSKLDLIMNSITVPRKAKQAVGGIALLKNSNGEEKTINVEYNQLDPLLRASGFPNGDVNDEKTGFSPYPGNINQLVFRLKPYTEALERTKGVMPEFVNPKYKDAEKTIFKKPTRLECMMQDFPTVLEGDAAKQVGFTSISADLCFSPVKNAIADGAALQKKGTAPGVAASGEADQYAAIRKIMKSIGCQVEEAEAETFSEISVIPGPEIVLKPNFVVCPAEYKEKFTSPSSVKISKSSSLIVSGSGVVIESLDLDGALVINCEEGASGVIRDVVVRNQGWKQVVDVSSSDEIISMRGYKMIKNDTQTITIKTDGSIDGLPKKEVEAEKPKPVSKPKETVNDSAPTSRSFVDNLPPAKANDVSTSVQEEVTDTTKEKTSVDTADMTDQDCGCIIL